MWSLRIFKDKRARKEQRWLKISLLEKLVYEELGKTYHPSTMDLFGIWKQLAQGQTGLIGGEAHRFSRLVWGLLIPLGPEPAQAMWLGAEKWQREVMLDLIKSCHSALRRVWCKQQPPPQHPSTALCWGWCAECQTLLRNNYLQLLLSIQFYGWWIWF